MFSPRRPWSLIQPPEVKQQAGSHSKRASWLPEPRFYFRPACLALKDEPGSSQWGGLPAPGSSSESLVSMIFTWPGFVTVSFCLATTILHLFHLSSRCTGFYGQAQASYRGSSLAEVSWLSPLSWVPLSNFSPLKGSWCQRRQTKAESVTVRCAKTRKRNRKCI